MVAYHAMCRLSRFLSTLSLRRATKYITGAKIHDPDFYPRSPCGERQYDPELYTPYALISIHALLAESDPHPGRTPQAPAPISIHALLAESDPAQPSGQYDGLISIHALLAESDHSTDWHVCHRPDFYPRSPCGERLVFTARQAPVRIFLATLSLRRATPHHAKGPWCVFDFYPRSPCGERPPVR